ncbi:MAG: hypothetical protein ABIL58_13980 [Pseudomonadota bacterium]
MNTKKAKKIQKRMEAVREWATALLSSQVNLSAALLEVITAKDCTKIDISGELFEVSAIGNELIREIEKLLSVVEAELD